MRLFRILTFKELKGFFLSPFGWVILGFVTVMQGISLSTADRGWRFARAWLYDAMAGADPGGKPSDG